MTDTAGAYPSVVAGAGLAPIADAIQITGGRYFRPLVPDDPMNEYDIEFIAHSLSLQCRWNGVTVNEDGSPAFYSVAQHSVIVADLVQMARRKLLPDFDWSNSPSPALYGLMHDASEAYITDIARPIKPYLTNYYALEDALMAVIIEKFNVPVNDGIREAVRRVDNLMIFLERDKLIGTPVQPYGNEADAPAKSIDQIVPEFYCWSPSVAKQRFLVKYAEIIMHDGNYVHLEYRNRGYGL